MCPVIPIHTPEWEEALLLSSSSLPLSQAACNIHEAYGEALVENLARLLRHGWEGVVLTVKKHLPWATHFHGFYLLTLLPVVQRALLLRRTSKGIVILPQDVEEFLSLLHGGNGKRRESSAPEPQESPSG